MTMANTSFGSTRTAINVTPLIDVLLVLLIIFMVIEPAVQRGLDTLAPHAATKSPTKPNPGTVVISVEGTSAAPSYTLNGQPVTFRQLGPELQRILARSGSGPLFVRGAAALDYGAVVPVIAEAHTSGASEIGLLTTTTLTP